jgi:poly(beta-D-mannuronate) lyase
MTNRIVVLLCACSLGMGAHATTHRVSTATELQAANASAKAGDTIVLRNGVWQNTLLELTCMGTEAAPIVVKAQTPGQVQLSGQSSLRLGGDYIVVQGLLFTNGYAPQGAVWELRAGNRLANHCRITQCAISNFSPANRMRENYWVALYGKHNRIDHCRFADKTNLGVLMAVILTDDRSRENYHRIDSNRFGPRRPLGSNGGEIIRIGVSEHCTYNSNTLVAHNLFDRCDGEAEIVSIKSGANIVRGNVFTECQGAVVLRHGNNNTVEGNLFTGNGKAGTGGVRIINEGNWVVNNYFYACRGEAFRAPLVVMNGVPNSPPHRYLPVRNTLIAHNTFVNCSPFSLGEGADAERTVAPSDVHVLNNIFYSSTDSLPFYAYSSLAGYHFAGNITGGAYRYKPVDGFAPTKLTASAWMLQPALPATPLQAAGMMPADMAEALPLRLALPLPKQAGSQSPTTFKTLHTQAAKAGPAWKAPTAPAATAPAPVACPNAAAVYQALATPKAVHHLLLTGTRYQFDKPIPVTGTLVLEGKANTITLGSSPMATALFIVSGSSTLSIKNLKADLQPLQAAAFIGTTADSTAVHYTLQLSGCNFSNLTAPAFAEAAKYSYAADITVADCSFSNIQATLLSMPHETDNKGLYNAERISILRCSFSQVSGQLLHVYRGGNDESTMGPQLMFAGNRITNCSAPAPLLQLHGVQRSELRGNTFLNANPGAAVLSYTDITKAYHLHGGNSFGGCGRVEENRWVVER